MLTNTSLVTIVPTNTTRTFNILLYLLSVLISKKGDIKFFNHNISDSAVITEKVTLNT